MYFNLIFVTPFYLLFMSLLVLMCVFRNILLLFMDTPCLKLKEMLKQWTLNSFICPSVYSFIHSFSHSLIFLHLFLHPFLHLFIPSFIHSSIRSFIYLFIRSFICSSICSLYSCIHLFVHSFIQSFPHIFLHSFTYPFTHSIQDPVFLIEIISKPAILKNIFIFLSLE